jgi:putative toxin-antitoxin system antitoxin component (TIGR02293 family)
MMDQELMAEAVRIFGSKEKALEWLKTPSVVLGGQSPEDLLSRSETGAVMDELGRIEHGVYS